MPEPWATRLVTEGGGKILVNEATLWPKGQFATTLLLVKKTYLDAHADVIQNLINGVDSIEPHQVRSDEGAEVTNDGLKQLTGKPLKAPIIAASFSHITFTLDPIASSLQTTPTTPRRSAS